MKPLVVIAMLLLSGCASSPTSTIPVSTVPAPPCSNCTNEVTGHAGIIAVVLGTNTYRFHRPATNNLVELWSRDGDSNHWYTPKLDWTLHPDHEPSFNSLLR